MSPLRNLKVALDARAILLLFPAAGTDRLRIAIRSVNQCVGSRMGINIDQNLRFMVVPILF
jgi:hypothetical protein